MTTKLLFFRVTRAVIPRLLIRTARDKWEFFKRFIPAKQVGIPKYGIGPTQVYPQGIHFIPILKKATKEKLLGIPLTAMTPIASIGTCFAEKFAYFMKEQGYNYVCTEDDALAASANWGRVYTIPNLLQIIHYSIDSTYPIVLEKSKHGWFDPLRESKVAYFQNKKEAEENIRAHRRASYQAFTTCEVLIITVGQNEAWVDTQNNKVWAKRPPQDVLALRQQEFIVKEFSFTENIAALREAIESLFSINPEVKCLFTVSPVASHATFSDIDIISQSFANKCLLRSVVEEVVKSKSDRLFYFPSFEMVLCDNPYNFCADNRHVKHATVNRIFSMLTKSTGLQSFR
jgi:hypothetical protein